MKFKTLTQLLERFPELKPGENFNENYHQHITSNKDDNSHPIELYIETNECEYNLFELDEIKTGKGIGYIDVEHMEEVGVFYNTASTDFDVVNKIKLFLNGWEDKFKESGKAELFETVEEAKQAYFDSLDGETSITEEEFLEDCFIVYTERDEENLSNEEIVVEVKKIMEIKTIDQARELGLDTFLYDNGDWGYEDTNDYYHIYREGKELLPKIKKIRTFSYPNGDWEYKDVEGYWHIFRGSEELLPDVRKGLVYSYSNGDWEYKGTDGYYHLIREGKELSPEIKKTYVNSYDNGDWEYEATDGDTEVYYHLIRDGKELLPEIKKIRTHSYKSGDWDYQDENGYWHLIRDGKELLPEIKKMYTVSFDNGDWVYRDINMYSHLFRDNKELLPEIKKLKVFSYHHGDWEYRGIEGYDHLIRDGEELLPDVKKKDVNSYDNGDWEYRDINDRLHLIKEVNNESDKAELELTRSIISNLIPVAELYVDKDGKTYSICISEYCTVIPKEQYDCIKELKDNGN